jgi:mono/diheme cytochrome c family protein
MARFQMRRQTSFTALLSVTLLANVYAALGAQAPATTRDGIFTAEQVTRGQPVYLASCGSCHGDDLLGGGFAPALTGETFLSAWTGQQLDGLYSRIKETMPADKPGSLSDQANADLLAYILKTNGFAPGTQPLPSGAAALALITIAKP